MLTQNFSTLEVEAGGLETQEQLWWYNDFEANLDYGEPALIKTKEHKQSNFQCECRERGTRHRDADQHIHYGRCQEDFTNK